MLYVYCKGKDAEGYLRNVYTSYCTSTSHARLARGRRPLFVGSIRENTM